MMRPIRALTWEILARHRWLVGGSAAWLLVACLVVASLPESARTPELGMLLVAPTILGVIAFLMSVTHGQETRLDTRAGAFPRRLLLLPVPAGLLAGVPLALVVLCSSLAWTITAAGVLRPCNAQVLLFSPGLIAGVLFAWLLALCWSPMPHCWARLALIAVLLTAFVSGGIAVEEFAWPEYRVLICLGVLLVFAAYLGIWGVSRSRSEVGEDAEAPGISTPLHRGVSFEPFRSRLRAQLWLEWRTHGRGLVILTLMLGFLFVPVAIMSEYVRQSKPWLFEYIANEFYFGMEPAWLPLSWLVFIPLIIAGASGGEAGRFARTQKTIGVPTFVGLMPIPSGDLLRGKFIACALHLALMWGVLLAVALGWAVFVGQVGGMAERLSETCGSPALACLTLLAALFGLFAITYAIHVGSMWGGLFGSPIFASLPAILGSLTIPIIIWSNSHWRPEYEPALWTGLWVALGAKFLLAAYLARHDLTRLRVGSGLLGAGVLVWAVFTAAFASLAGWLIGDTAALAVVVLSPLVSWLATPAVLHRSRHGAWA